jgi:hypothetical protein
LSQLQTDQSIAENAGQKRDLQDSADNFANQTKTAEMRFLFFNDILK